MGLRKDLLMRKISFRAWAIATKEMFYPNSDDGWEIRDGEIYPLSNSILMQFTGLKDFYGKDGYEGDVIEEKERGFKAKIVFYEGAFYAEDEKNKTRVLLGACMITCEVIGNIYENPELLK